MGHSNEMYDIKLWLIYFFPSYQNKKVFFANALLRKAQRLGPPGSKTWFSSDKISPD